MNSLLISQFGHLESRLLRSSLHQGRDLVNVRRAAEREMVFEEDYPLLWRHLPLDLLLSNNQILLILLILLPLDTFEVVRSRLKHQPRKQE